MDKKCSEDHPTDGSIILASMPMKFSLMQIYHFILSHKYSEMWKKKKKLAKWGVY
jgi:hypothetical protein